MKDGKILHRRPVARIERDLDHDLFDQFLSSVRLSGRGFLSSLGACGHEKRPRRALCGTQGSVFSVPFVLESTDGPHERVGDTMQPVGSGHGTRRDTLVARVQNAQRTRNDSVWFR